MEEILKDKRFAHVAKDPRFRKMPVGERKVKIDKRFKGMFKDKRFKLKYSVDKRGKPVDLTTNENLKKYYELSDESSGEDDEASKTDKTENKSELNKSFNKKNKGKGKKSVKESKAEKKKAISEEVDDNDEVLTKIKGKKKKKSFQDDLSEEDELVDIQDSDTDKQGQNSSKNNKGSKAVDPRFQIDKLQNGKAKSHTIPDPGTSGNKLQAVPIAGTSGVKSNTVPVAGTSGVKSRTVPVTGTSGVKSHTVPDAGTSGIRGKTSQCQEDDCGNPSDSSVDDSSEEDDKPVGQDSGVDFARGEGNMYSSSDDDTGDDNTDESDWDDDQDVSKFDHRWGETDENIVTVEEATSRLAVCNMDWDRMKAKDIYVLINSFKPADGTVKSVKVYPSEFGKERMAEEATHGPRELKEMKIDSDEDGEDVVDEEGTVYHTEKLRQYQLNRLKYYYAVVECDSPTTADHIYKECDGMEYESSATKLDLRFIPDEEMFDEADVSSECLGPPSNYKPQYFINSALSQSKVELTWDETDRERVELTARQFLGVEEDGDEENLKAYLASSSDEEGVDYGALFGETEEGDEDDGEESDEDRKLNKYKLLLTEIDKEEKKKKRDVEMEISWEPGLRETTESLVKKKKASKSKTVWEDYLEKKKEKKKQKIEERKKKKQRQVADSDSEDEQAKQAGMGDDSQAFSDDELPVDDDMRAFMDEENLGSHGRNNSDKKKRKKKKKGKNKTDEERPEDLKEKAELSLLMMDEEENKKHFNLRDLVQDDEKKKKKKKQKEQTKMEDDEDFKMNVKDSRFSAMYESHLFNIDPSAPEYRKTKGTEAIISEKIKRSGKRDNPRDLPASGDKSAKKQKLTENKEETDTSLQNLIKSVKSKTKHFQSNKSKR